MKGILACKQHDTRRCTFFFFLESVSGAFVACCRDNAQIWSDPLPRAVLRAVRNVAQKNILHLRVQHMDPLYDVTKML